MTTYLHSDTARRDVDENCHVTPLCTCGRTFVFQLKHFVPAHGDAFVPPADNPQAHNNRSKPGYDPRCQPAAKIPARFYLVCECGQGWYRDALESDLRISPALTMNEIAKAIDSMVREKIADPAVCRALGAIVYREALRELVNIGLVDLLGEIPVRWARDIEHIPTEWATDVAKNFVAQFMQPMAAAPPELRRSTNQSPKE